MIDLFSFDLELIFKLLNLITSILFFLLLQVKKHYFTNLPLLVLLWRGLRCLYYIHE